MGCDKSLGSCFGLLVERGDKNDLIIHTATKVEVISLIGESNVRMMKT